MSTTSQSRSAANTIANADAEIARFKDILRQIDELEMEFDKYVGELSDISKKKQKRRKNRNRASEESVKSTVRTATCSIQTMRCTSISQLQKQIEESEEATSMNKSAPESGRDSLLGLNTGPNVETEDVMNQQLVEINNG
ncbi:hypothetical protein MMC18_006577 [Xylographa bjoerkii]|nr:hypothetical protein [Xylographa bjoerkii]